MESPIKKLDFSVGNKENMLDVAAFHALGKPAEADKASKVDEVKKDAEAPVVAPGIKVDEMDEPLLQENPQRFVLFPIKYHEVCNASHRVKC